MFRTQFYLREDEEMSTAKEEIKRLIEQQPDDSSFEELIKELAFSVAVRQSLEDSDAGRAVPNEEMRRRIRTWRN